jgi:hypothetical protein
MKYARLTKEQFEELHEEFSRFLATRSISRDDWVVMKASRPEAVEEELDLFSDLVWEGVLGNVSYLENISEQQMHLFYAAEKEIRLISVKVLNPEIDLRNQEGFTWFKKNWQSDFVDYLSASKSFTDERSKEVFDLIQQGAIITKGELFIWFDGIIE